MAGRRSELPLAVIVLLGGYFGLNYYQKQQFNQDKGEHTRHQVPMRNRVDKAKLREMLARAEAEQLAKQGGIPRPPGGDAGARSES